MSGRYLVADYKTEEDEKPRIASRTDDLQDAEKAFENSSQRKIKSAVLFDTEKNEFLLIAIGGEPIHLVNVIEFARGYLNTENQINFIDEKTAKAAAGVFIGYIVKAKTRAGVGAEAETSAAARETIPLGVGGVLLDRRILGPYYSIKDGMPKMPRVIGGFFGGVFGAALGLVIGGPYVAIVGGAVGSYWGAAITKSCFHPLECINCQGIGLVDALRRCPKCEGYGYRKE